CPQQSARQAGKGAPSRGIGAARKRIDQEFDAVLSAHRTGNGAQHGGKNGRMRDRPQTNVTKNERERGSGISRKVSHARFMPSTGIAVSLPRRLSPSLNEPKPSLFRRPELQQSIQYSEAACAYRAASRPRRVEDNAAPTAEVPVG